LREQEKQKLTDEDRTSHKTIFASVEKSGMRRRMSVGGLWHSARYARHRAKDSQRTLVQGDAERI